MMPKWLAVPFLFAVGALLLCLVYRGLQNGELPAGANFGSGSYRPNRVDNPFAFRFFLVLYFCTGIALCVWWLLAMLGMAPTLRWRLTCGFS